MQDAATCRLRRLYPTIGRVPSLDIATTLELAHVFGQSPQAQAPSMRYMVIHFQVTELTNAQMATGHCMQFWQHE